MTAAIILAGGAGTRMMPLTARTPKPLLRVAGRPLVAHQLERLAAAGVCDVVLATSAHAGAFEPLLGDGSAWGLRLRYAVEPTPEGTGGGVRQGLRALRDAGPADEPVLVVNGDLLSGHSLAVHLDTLDLAVAHDPATLAAVHVRPVPDARAYGLVRCAVPDGDEPPQATEFIEKPPEGGPGLVNAGTYAVRPEILTEIPDVVVSFERDVLPRLAAAGRLVVHLETAPWLDVGTPDALRRATLAMVRDGSVPAIAPDAEVAADALVDGSWVGPGVRVGAGAVLSGCVLQAGARVGAAARLERCVLAEGAGVADGTIARDEVFVA